MTIEQFLSGLEKNLDPVSIKGQNTSFQFNISGECGGEYTLCIDDGQLSWEKGLHGEAKCTIKASAESFEKLLTGKLNPMMAVLTGKLKISNQAEMLKYAKILGLM